jgi:hypothetical protein
MPSFLRRLSLVLALTASAGLVAVSVTPQAYAKAKKKKGKKSKSDSALATEDSTPKKVTVKTIFRWRKSGLSDAEIASKANDAGYQLTAADKAKLKKGHASKALIAALGGKDAEPEAAKATVAQAPAPSAKPTTPGRMIDPNEIDFDSVPPPAGIPSQYMQSNHPSPKKKPPIDRSMRPSAAFDDKEAATAQAQPSKPRAQLKDEPIAKEQPKPGRTPPGTRKNDRPSSPPVASASSGGNRRVVFTGSGE